MPNHIYQTLTIAGRAGDVEAFTITAKGARPDTGDKPDKDWGILNSRGKPLEVEPLCLHMIAPLPDEFSTRPYGRYPDNVGYKLECDLWGTKWGCYDTSGPIIAPAGPAAPEGWATATYTFTGAWGPSLKAWRRASVRYPQIRFYLSWGGEGPERGRALIHDGVDIALCCERWPWPDLPEYPEGVTREEDAWGDDDWSEQVNRLTNFYRDQHDAWVATDLAGYQIAHKADGGATAATTSSSTS